MKAIYAKEGENISPHSIFLQPIGSTFKWDKEEDLHHLLRVSRLAVGEEVLFLNGKGVAVKAIFQSQHKFKRAEFIISEILTKETLPLKISLVVGKIKKSNFEDTLVDAVELGVDSFTPIDTQYSQRYELSKERMALILKHAYQQSNRFHVMKLCDEISFESFLKHWIEQDSASNILLFFNVNQTQMDYKSFPAELKNANVTVLIGPEGGWSPQELALIHQLKNERSDRVFEVELPTPILRATTACVAAVGFVIGKFATFKS